MKDEELNAITANITARVPYPIKIKIQERAMRYRMNLNEYMNIMIGTIAKNEDLMDPAKIQEMSEAIGQLENLKSKLEKSEAELDQERQEHEEAVKAWSAAMEAIVELTADKDKLKSDLKAARDDNSKLTKNHQAKSRNVSQTAQKSVREANEKAQAAEKQAKELQARLDKANKRLKDEDIRDSTGIFDSGKLVQF